MAWPKKKSSQNPRKHWKKLSVHPMLHRHIMGSPILAPMAMPPDEEAGEIPGQPDPDDLPSEPFAGK